MTKPLIVEAVSYPCPGLVSLPELKEENSASSSSFYRIKTKVDIFSCGVAAVIGGMKCVDTYRTLAAGRLGMALLHTGIGTVCFVFCIKKIEKLAQNLLNH
jgi:hypothetical protein